MAYAILKDEIDSGVIPYGTDGSAHTPGDILQIIDGRAGVVLGLNAIGTTDPYTVATEGIFLCTCDTLTASAGAKAWWDSGNHKVVTSMPTAGFELGVLVDDVASGDVQAPVLLNARPKSVDVASTYASGTWTVKLGLATVNTLQVSVRTSAGVQKLATVTISGDTVTIADNGGSYTRSAGDIATIHATGVGV